MSKFQVKTMSPIFVDDSNPRKKPRHAFVLRGSAMVETLKFRTELEAKRAQKEYRKQGFKVAK